MDADLMKGQMLSLAQASENSQNKCNHRSIGGGYTTVSHTFVSGEKWLRCVRCAKTWKNVSNKAGDLTPPTTEEFDRIAQETSEFLNENPEYYPCPENFVAIRDYISVHGLKPGKDSFQVAFNAMQASLSKKPVFTSIASYPKEVDTVNTPLVPSSKAQEFVIGVLETGRRIKDDD